jgi:hypothetical protein
VDLKQLQERLAEPFEPSEVKFKPQAVKNGRAMAVPYIDARLVAERLDRDLGLGGWEDDYTVLPSGEVVCHLTLHLSPGVKVTRCDVGGQSDQPDDGDKLKAAFSDALKRAAVKFGIGRYLYRINLGWVDYDEQKRRFVKAPALPAHALPPHRSGVQPANGSAGSAAKAALPAGGQELAQRLVRKEIELVQAGRCRDGDLFKALRAAGQAEGLGDDVAKWEGEAAMKLAVRAYSDFEKALPPAGAASTAVAAAPVTTADKVEAPKKGRKAVTS